MSAAFKFQGDVFWGTNGAVEAYVAGLRDAALEASGAQHPLAVFFGEELAGFFPGKVILLDECLRDAGRLGEFLRILDATTARLMREQALSEVGQAWADSVVARLREKVVLASRGSEGARDG